MKSEEPAARLAFPSALSMFFIDVTKVLHRRYPVLTFPVFPIRYLTTNDEKKAGYTLLRISRYMLPDSMSQSDTTLSLPLPLWSR